MSWWDWLKWKSGYNAWRLERIRKTKSMKLLIIRQPDSKMRIKLLPGHSMYVTVETNGFKSDIQTSTLLFKKDTLTIFGEDDKNEFLEEKENA
jgi:hypothetical protein